MLPYNIHHVAIAVRDLDAAIDGYRTQYQVEPLSREVIAEQGVEEAMLAIGGSHVHHIAFAVVDIEAALEHLAASGARLVDETPRIGGGGHRIAFVHPASLTGTLIELVEVTP